MSSFVTEDDIYIGLEEFTDKPGRRVEKVSMSVEAKTEIDKLSAKAFLLDALLGGEQPFVRLWLDDNTGRFYVGVTDNPKLGAMKLLPLSTSALIQKWEATK